MKGRIGCYELLIVDELVRAEVMKRSSSRAIESAARAGGHLTSLQESAADLVAARVTTVAEAVSAVKS